MTDTIDSSAPSPSPEPPRAAPSEPPPAAPAETSRAAREEQYEQAHQQRVEARAAKVADYEKRQAVKDAEFAEVRAAREEQYELAHQQRVEARAAKVADYEKRQAVKDAEFAEVRAAREEQYEQAHQQRVEARVAKIAAYNERHGQDAEAARASAERTVRAEETRFRDAQQRRGTSGPSGTGAATARPAPPQSPWVSPPTPANATFWNHTRQETDEAGRRWLVNLETGERVRLGGQLMDDGTVRYPNGDVEPAGSWNRISPPPAAAAPPARPTGRGPATPPGAPGGGGPWSTLPPAGSPGAPGEVTGLVSAQAYAQGMSAALGSHAGPIEAFVAVLIGADVSGDAVSCAVRAQELTLETTRAWTAADSALSQQHVVREAYAAAPEAGGKEWVTQGD